MKGHPPVLQATLFAACLFFCTSYVFAQTLTTVPAPPPAGSAAVSATVDGSAGDSSHQSGDTKDANKPDESTASRGTGSESEHTDQSGDARGKNGEQHTITLTPKEAIQLVASRIASSTLVVPNAAAPRILEGAVSTQAEAHVALEGAQLIQTLREEHTQNATSSVQSIVQTLTEHAHDSSSIQNFVQAIVQAAAPTSSVPLPPQILPTRRDDSETHATATEPTTSRGEDKNTHAAQVQNLEALGKNIHAIDFARNAVVKQVSTAVAESVDQSVQEISKRGPIQAEGTTATSREARIEDIKQQADQKGEQVVQQITQTVLRGGVSPQQVDPVLQSSLQDIATLVQAQSGVPVSAPVGSRAVATEIQSAAQDIAQNQQALAQRGGLDLYRDSDHDGISDYDEVHIYHTDPNNAFTGGGNITDGERVLLGLDPHTAEIKAVPVQSPASAGVETNSVFEVSAIVLVGTTTQATAAATTSAAAAGPAPAAAQGSQPIRFSGRALPNSFVTLYIFSEPVVVTVKTDQNGAWTYTLDTSLPDGQHQLYVATVDDQGNILAKSPAVPFTKTAEALSFTPLSIQEPTAPSPLDTLRQHFLVTAGVLLALFTLAGILTLGFRGNTPTPTAA